jgi:hypothetical protein
MTQAEEKFHFIAEKMFQELENVELGKMMSSPGIKYKTKVFAFFYQDRMVFRLGKGFDPTKVGVGEYSLLSPFKNKAPLAGWFEIPYDYESKWEELAQIALSVMKEKIG